MSVAFEPGNVFGASSIVHVATIGLWTPDDT
jgi:hypothetical protein